MRMKTFDDCFHTVLNMPAPTSNVRLQSAQLSYARPHSINAGLHHQDAILKEMKTAQQGNDTQTEPETEIGKAALHNLQLTTKSAEWIDLDTALKGPRHVAKTLHQEIAGRSFYAWQILESQC